MKAALPSLKMDTVEPTLDTLIEDIFANNPGMTTEDYSLLRYRL